MFLRTLFTLRESPKLTVLDVYLFQMLSVTLVTEIVISIPDIFTRAVYVSLS